MAQDVSIDGSILLDINNDPDRLKYPQKRVGQKGEGKWQRISWDGGKGPLQQGKRTAKGCFCNRGLLLRRAAGS